MLFLIAESETAPQRTARRRSVGRSAGETFEAVLTALAPDARCRRVRPADGEIIDIEQLSVADAVFLTGSPLHAWADRPEVHAHVEFMKRVFASGTPAFGSCAGLQIACVAAGGRVRPMRDRREAGFARRLAATPEGREHPLLAGRPPAWDAPAVHSDEVEDLPPGALHLAGNGTTRVQAAEIVHDGGTFWGVQYHPELSLFEVAAALRRQAAELVAAGLTPRPATIRTQAALVERLAREPTSRDLAWRLGLNAEVTDPARRRRELANFIAVLVRPIRRQRGREH